MAVIYQGDNNIVFNLTITEEGQVVNLTDTTVEVLIRLKDKAVVKLAEIVDAPNGKCKIILYSSDLIYAGVYSLQATTTFADGGKYTSNIQRFSVEQKIGYIPSLSGGGGGSTNITTSDTNGNIKVNGVEVKVYNENAVKTDISDLKASKHTHTNVEQLERIGINNLGKMTIDNVEYRNGDTIENSLTNGNIRINGQEINVFDPTTLDNEISNIKNSDTFKRLAVNSNGRLAIDGVEYSGGGNGSIPSNTILFEDWVDGETVTIDTGGTPPADTIAPNNVTNLITSNVTSTTLILSWTASTSTDIASYEVYRGSTILTTVTGTTYNVTGLTEKTQYTFTIKAKDANGNVANGTSITITTADVTAPNNVTNLATSNITATSLTLTWTASTSTDVSGYEVYNGSTLLGTATTVSYNVSGLTANTAYTFVVKAKDSSNNVASGASVNATTSSVVDTTTPNDVTNLATSNLSTTSVTLSWTESSSADVASYEIYNGVSLLSTTTSTSYTVTGLTASTSYTLTVKAKDGAGNVSTGASTTFTTVTPDTTAPDNVTNLTTSNETQTSLTLSWTASVSSDVASYDVFNGTTLLGNVTGTTYNVTGLTASTAYTFVVKAKDSSNNVATGTSVNSTTLAPADTTAPVLTITPAQTFTDSMTVNMSTNETATIWYTIDDSDPITSGTRLQYTAPITITETDTFKAYAVDSANNASAVQTVTYTKQTVNISQEVVYPENGYLVIPFNSYPAMTKVAGLSTTEYTTVNTNNDVSTLFDKTDLATTAIIGNLPYVAYANVGTTNSELFSFNGTRIFVKTTVANGSLAADVRNYLINNFETLKVKLVSNYQTFNIPSAVSGVSTRTSGVDTTNFEYFKCTLTGGIGTYNVDGQGGYKTFASNGSLIIATNGYVFSATEPSLRINADSTLEMLLPKGTLSSIDATGVSAYLAAANIKIYFV